MSDAKILETPSAAPAEPPNRRRRLALDFALCILGISFGFWIFPLPILGTDLSRLPGDEIDGRFNNYVLEHGYRYIRGDEPSFWTMPIFYPAPQTTALSDNHLGTLPIYAAFRTAGFDRETAYQLWWLAILALNYAIGYGALRGFGLSPLGAALGAFVFAFGMPVQTMIGHLQVYPRFGVPLAFLWGYRFFLTGRTRYFLGTGLAFVWQMFATIYVGYFLALALVGFLVVAAVVHRREFAAHVVRARWKTWLGRAVVLGLCIAPIVQLAKPYREAAKPEMYEKNLEDIRRNLPAASTWVAPLSSSKVWGEASGAVPPSTVQHFPGAAALLGLLAAFLPARRPETRAIRSAGLAAVGSVLLIFAIFLKLGDDSPYYLLAQLPGVAAIRSVERVVVVLLFPFGLLAAGAVTRIELAFCTHPAIGLALAIIFAAFGIAEQQLNPNVVYTIDKSAMQDRSARLADRITAVDPEARLAVLLVPLDGANPRPFAVAQLDMMMAAQSLGIATPNGYSGHSPPHWICPQTIADVRLWMLESHERYAHLRPSLIHRYRENGFSHFVVLEADSSRDAVVRHRMTRMDAPLTAEGCPFKLEVLEPPNPWPTGEKIPLRVRATNESNAVWRARERANPTNATDRDYRMAFRIFVAYRWTAPDGTAVPGYGFNDRLLTFLRYDIDPASSDVLEVAVDAPPQPGRYLLELSMGQGENNWFHVLAPQPTSKTPIEVRSK